MEQSQQSSTIKRLLLILTIGNIGLHYFLTEEPKKSLPLLISFLFAIFSLTTNMFMIYTSGMKGSTDQFADALLNISSPFTIIFFLSLILNRILWVREFALLLRTRNTGSEASGPNGQE